MKIQHIVKHGGGDKETEELQRATLDQKLPVSDYLVGKVLYTEKRVLEAINKLTIVKDWVLKGHKNRNFDESPAGDLLSHHLRQTMISRSQIETEFMKKKIHFVSDFKLYNDINMDSNPHTF